MEVLNACIPYLEFGFTYQNPDSSETLSPFMGGSYINNLQMENKIKKLDSLKLSTRLQSLRDKH